MKPKSSHRYRICGTPVKTGCITCKIRRVKCGEEKPNCNRCTSTGRKCDGYTTPAKARPFTQRDVSWSLSPTPLPLEDPTEQNVLSFFTTFTAPKLSGHFSSNFWEQRVMRATTEPSVRHGVIAIGTVHQNFVSRHENASKEVDSATEAFAFRQHAKAISHLQQLMSTNTQQLDITLITCILFICFDCLLGNHTSAVIHLQAGLKILEDIKLQNAQDSPFAHTTSAQEWEQEFTPILLALGVQAASFVDPRNHDDRSALWAALNRAAIPTFQTMFTSLDDARHALETLASKIMVDRLKEDQIPNFNTPESPRHVAKIARWEEVFEKSLPNIVQRSTIASKTQLGGSMLKIHAIFFSVFISAPEHSEDRFNKLLEICGTIISAKKSPEPTFSIDLGLIGPLCFTALRAPRKSIQRRAFHMLLQAPGREGIWDAEDAVRIAGEALEFGGRLQSSKISTPYGPRTQHQGQGNIDHEQQARFSGLHGQEEGPLTGPECIMDCLSPAPFL